MNKKTEIAESEFRSTIRRKLIERMLLESANLKNKPTNPESINNFRAWVNSNDAMMAQLKSLYQAANFDDTNLDKTGNNTSKHFNIAWVRFGDQWPDSGLAIRGSKKADETEANTADTTANAADTTANTAETKPLSLRGLVIALNDLPPDLLPQAKKIALYIYRFRYYKLDPSLGLAGMGVIDRAIDVVKEYDEKLFGPPPSTIKEEAGRGPGSPPSQEEFRTNITPPVQAQIPDRTLSFNSDTALYSLYLGIVTVMAPDNDNAKIIIQAGNDFHKARRALTARNSTDSDKDRAEQEAENAAAEVEAHVEDAIDDAAATPTENSPASPEVSDATGTAVNTSNNRRREEAGVGREPQGELALDRFVLKYNDSNKDALIIYLPRAYRPRDGAKSANGFFLNLGDPRTVLNLRNSRQVPDSQKKFILNFGRYEGMVPGKSLFTSNEINLETMKSLIVYGPNLPLSSIKDTDLGKTVNEILKVGKYLEKLDKKLQGQNDTFKAKMKKIKDLASALKDAEFDEVHVKSSAGTIKRARFTRNSTPPGVDLRLLDKINGRIINGKFSFKKAKEAYKNKKLLSFLSIDDAVNESVEKEIYNIIKDVIHQDQKKKLAERIGAQNLVRDKKGRGKELDSGKTKVPTSKKSGGTLIGALALAGLGDSAWDMLTNKEYKTPDGVFNGISRPLGKESIKITSHAGERISPTPGGSTDHKAIDISASEGTPVLAIADGEVIKVVDSRNDDRNSCGYRVSIEHNRVRISGSDYRIRTSLYCHLKAVESSLKAGDTVSAGQKIGEVGTTGVTTGPHLHLSINWSNDRDIYAAYLAAISSEAREDLENMADGGEVEVDSPEPENPKHGDLWTKNSNEKLYWDSNENRWVEWADLTPQGL